MGPFTRSATAPLTMVAPAVQKAHWKNLRRFTGIPNRWLGCRGSRLVGGWAGGRVCGWGKASWGLATIGAKAHTICVVSSRAFENLLGRFGAPYFLEPKHVSSLNCTTVYDNMRVGLHISTLLLAGGCLITRTATIQCGSRSLDQGLTNLEDSSGLLLLL